jgi:hypothetical protein
MNCVTVYEAVDLTISPSILMAAQIVLINNPISSKIGHVMLTTLDDRKLQRSV